MSQENVENLRAMAAVFSTETIHALLEAWRRGEADLALLDPEVTYEDHTLPDHVGDVYSGHDGVLKAMETWSEPYEQMTNELERIVGSGDRLVSIHRFRARARYTGIEFDQPSSYAWTFRDGKIVRIEGFWDTAEALAAAGLQE